MPHKKEKKYNEAGQLLTKKGQIDKRVENIKIQREKSTVYQAIVDAKKQKKEQKEKALANIPDSESDTESEPDEYEIEEKFVVKKINEPQVVEKEVVKEVVVEKEVEKVVVKPDPKTEARMKKVEEQNRELKSKFDLSEYYKSIGGMSRKMGIHT